MDACPPPDDLADLLGHDGSGPPLAALRRHVRACARCQALLDALSGDTELDSWVALARPARRAIEPGPALGRVLAELRAARRPRPVTDSPGVYSFLGPARREGDLGTLGPYPVREELGRGGMGIVLLGFDEALQRPVALKVLRPELADGPARERFEREARAAARVRHDHVVGVHGVDRTADGLPFCILEYLAGPSLARRIRDEGTLPPREAAAVAAQVADGLAAAHGAGLIHRDIKPANLLFDPATGRAKIADFGLARAEASPAGPTRDGALIGTPAYMSPEQAAGTERVGPAADVYSLGATLYEALTGEPPFRGATHAVLHRIRDEVPRPPRALNGAVPRDLETICLKAMAKEPRRRYASAGALADDLRRFLAGEPIAARPVTALGRAVRRARRRPALAALGAFSVVAAAALVVGGVFYTLHLRAANRRAEASLGKALEAVNRMLTRVGGEELADVPETERVRRDLLADARALLRDLMAGEDRADDPTIRHELARVHGHLGRVHALLGEPDAALTELRRAVAGQRRLAAEFPDRPAHRREQALGHQELGRVLGAQYRATEAEAEFDAARALLEPLAPTDPAARRALALCCDNLAVLIQARGRSEPAERLALRAVALLAEDGASTELAQVCNGLGNLHSRAGRAEPAEAAYRRALALWERLLRERPNARANRAGLAECGNGLGNLYAFTRRFDEARPLLVRGRELREALARDFPRAPGVRDDLARAHHSLGVLHFHEGRHGEAASEYERAVAIRERLAREHSGLARRRRLLAETYQNLALAYQCSGRGEPALESYAKAASILDALRADFPAERELANLEAIVLINSGLLRAAVGRAEEAVAGYDRAVTLIEGAGGPRPEDPGTRRLLHNAHGARAQALGALGRHAEAAEDWGRAGELASAATDRAGYGVLRCLSLIRAGDHTRAAGEAGTLADLEAASGAVLYDVACVFSLASAAAREDRSLEPSTCVDLADRLADRAVETLGRADTVGFFRDRARVVHMEADADLDPLRSRADYRALSSTLQDRAFPTDVFAP